MRSQLTPTISRFLLVAVLLTLGASPELVGRATDAEAGELAAELPGFTDDGSWDGTWWYMNRDFRIVFWFRTERGRPRLKAQYLSSRNLEGFETDWKGKAEYVTARAKGAFEIDLKRAGKDRIDAEMDWTLNFENGGSRVERGKMTLYRSGFGRALILKFHEWERVIDRGGSRPPERHSLPHSWTFRKSSRRIVRWEELPF